MNQDPAHLPILAPSGAGTAPRPILQSVGCESEPVHTPGAIQPHGAFIAALADGMVVSHASANLVDVLGLSAEAVLGGTLEEALGEETCRALLDLDAPRTIVCEPLQAGTRPRNVLNLRAFRSGRHVCVDIEPVPSTPSQGLPMGAVEAVLETFEHAASRDELCELAVSGLKALSGYDRVMAYRFVECGHGEVIAEAKEPALVPYLGQRYPSHDIPPQARRLYMRRRVGSIADAAYEPVLLLTDPALDDGLPLDLTHSSLRSVSPFHREYMRNMQTAASLTIGLAQGPDLWGMLVCHHSTPRTATPELRAAAGTIGLVVSLLLASLADAELYAQRLERGEILRTLVDGIAVAPSLQQGLSAAGIDLLRLVDAGGAMVRIAGEQAFVGSTPEPAAAAAAMSTLMDLSRADLLALDDIGLKFPALSACTAHGSGALLLRLAPSHRDAILWFRPELPRTLVWGGNPSDQGSTAAADPLSPRASFAAWKETVSGRSAPWSEANLALARELAAALQVEAAKRTKAELRDTQARLGLLAEHSGVVVVLNDLEGIRRYVSPAAERVLGWRSEELVGRPSLDFVHPDDRQAVRDANEAMRRGDPQGSASYRFRRPDGSWLWIDGNARPRKKADGQGPQDYVVVLRDASERKLAEFKLLEALESMQQMAATDGMTGLANRRHLDTIAQREWRRCSRDRLPLSVLLIDADRFKLFNDHYGHLAGDDCLRAVASQISAIARRPGDIAARYGGEEFVLLMPATDAAGALGAAQHLCDLVRQLEIRHQNNGEYGVVTVSIGTATSWPADHADDAAGLVALFSAADTALYRAKCNGRNRIAAG